MAQLGGIKLFFLLWAISAAIAYFQFSKPGNPMVLPGDIYIRKMSKVLYIPTGTSFYLAIVLFIIVKFLFKLF
ncbi:hypothetical protein A3A76_03170 [Candidatus Woesebacteria bacterium RIFCSPLOWO2_01_FULL_39_23]|uniref:DUF2905 domain-containing protein n=1 Tax=Candidatus Woesebacteria bacterium RIFCSPHIGHO2_01_FULL_40_22 TaxID=1802499 RepID=A0A1F7YJM0_9BACT|nr:MAG: hypothetical protein A2141_00855 [Candidatus Woesebacteria bacterium RBG_16_40_11]OGM27462.1 MAG: hypothetical protein A2628_01570 [Candidatus Woesebacteria bacterium RIFCSPHIGHO2_01_FULL_40_22]OGM36580.1 MAG: hypothetical protein A3E41_04075 [Candidatus Woesebacteria bacterium RIFCSPHIGHO2_12_FULL_38_9]OGM62636.1 MAG: hypothetical protein A3A76_03170 [Candidatus Woesebacteria bacterium RIFCSPLOWO2_01_FULL_39_23]